MKCVNNEHIDKDGLSRGAGSVPDGEGESESVLVAWKVSYGMYL